MPGDTPSKTSKHKRQQQARNHSPGPARHTIGSGLQDDMLAMQSVLGNRTVSQLLESGASERPLSANGIPPIVNEVLKSGSGQPIEPVVRAEMEMRFGHDFSRVRVHTDTKAAESAKMMSAKAYTVGQDIVFGSGRYEPTTTNGKQLVVHELAHIVQQQNGLNGGYSQSRTQLQATATAHEREAQGVATHWNEGHTSTVSLAVPFGTIQCETAHDDNAKLYNLYFKFGAVELRESGLNYDQALHFLDSVRRQLFKAIQDGIHHIKYIAEREEEHFIVAPISAFAAAPSPIEAFTQWRKGRPAREMLSEMMFGLSRPEVDIWNPVYPHLDQAKAALKRHSLAEAEHYLRQAGESVSKAYETIKRYNEGSVIGAERVRFVLEIAKQAGSIAADILGKRVAGQAGGIVAGAFYSGLQNFAEQGSEVWIAQIKSEIDWGSIGFDVLFNLITAGLGKKLGAAKQAAIEGSKSALGKVALQLDIKHQLLKRLAKNPEMASLGKKAFAQVAEDIVSGRANAILYTTARSVFDKMCGKEPITLETFLDRLCQELHPKNFVVDVVSGYAGRKAHTAVENVRAQKSSNIPEPAVATSHVKPTASRPIEAVEVHASNAPERSTVLPAENPGAEMKAPLKSDSRGQGQAEVNPTPESLPQGSSEVDTTKRQIEGEPSLASGQIQPHLIRPHGEAMPPTWTPDEAARFSKDYMVKGFLGGEGIAGRTEGVTYLVRIGEAGAGKGGGSWGDHIFTDLNQAKQYAEGVARTQHEGVARESRAIPQEFDTGGVSKFQAVKICEVPPGTANWQGVVAPQNEGATRFVDITPGMSPEAMIKAAEHAAETTKLLGGGPQVLLDPNVKVRPIDWEIPIIPGERETHPSPVASSSSTKSVPSDLISAGQRQANINPSEITSIGVGNRSKIAQGPIVGQPKAEQAQVKVEPSAKPKTGSGEKKTPTQKKKWSKKNKIRSLKQKSAASAPVMTSELRQNIANQRASLETVTQKPATESSQPTQSRTELLAEYVASGKVKQLKPGPTPTQEQQVFVPTHEEASLRTIQGDGPETEAVNIANRAQAGMARKPRHHVFPQEHQEWFAERGFTRIDDFTVELDQSTHEAIHGGGDWELARQNWPDEWNTRIMSELEVAEAQLRSNTNNPQAKLSVRDIITIGRRLMREYGINQSFLPYED